MGLFDNLLGMVDETLKAIEDGAIEKTLVNAVDMLENGLDKAVGTAENIAAAPENLLNKAEQTTHVIEEKVQVIGGHVSDMKETLQRSE